MKYKSETEKGIVHLWDLPEDKIYLNFEEPYKVEMVELGKKLAGGRNELGRKLEIYPQLITNFLRFASAPLNFIRKISDFLLEHGFHEYSLNQIEKNVMFMKASGTAKHLIKPKLPFDFNFVPKKSPS